jgi:hypothetical protein
VCFVVCNTISELECTILTTLFLLVQKTPTVGAPRRGICSAFSFRRSNGSFYVKLTRDEAICFKDLEIIADHLDNLCLLPNGDDSRVVVRGIACSGDDLATNEEESSSSPIPMACHGDTTPISTTLPPEETLMHQTIPAVPQRVAIPRSDLSN